MSIKKPLKDIVGEILSDMDSEGINSISDTVEAQQVASIVERTFYNLIANKVIPENEQLLKLVAYSDLDYPAMFKYPENIKKVTRVWYMVDGDYREVRLVSPEEFLRRTDLRSEDYVDMIEPKSGTLLKIGTDQNPSFYTSFDDQNLVFNSFDITVDDTLKAAKIRAFGAVYPNFKIEDDYIPECDGNFFAILINEAKSTAMSVLKGTVDPKVDQAARRQRFFHQNDRYNSERPNKWNDFSRATTGRRSSPVL